MEEDKSSSEDSPKPLAFTIDFGGGKLDAEKHKTMIEKYQKRHKRGQSLSKLEQSPPKPTLPRKSSFQSEGYFSSDENKAKNLTLPLKNTTEPFLQMLNDTSPELHESPRDIEGDKSDTVSESGTYVLESETYSEEQKARMSIDREFQLEQISLEKKTEEFLKHIPEGSSPLSLQEEVFDLNCSEKKPPISPKRNNDLNQTFSKIMFPSPRSKRQGLDELKDQGCVISVTSSGAFRSRNEAVRKKLSNLSKSEVHVEAFIDNKVVSEVVATPITTRKAKLTANIVNVEEITETPRSGKCSPSKIPSPIHTLRGRSRLLNNDIDTENILEPTQNFINSLQRKLSLEQGEDFELQLNTAHYLKQKIMHIRHNSLDDNNSSNKLEHFQNKNLIDQTLFNQCGAKLHKIQNSPNNSPIRRSSSFSTKYKNTNVLQNLAQNRNCSPKNSIQRSSSSASIKPEYLQKRLKNFEDTESSSEEDRRSCGARVNRAFNLRRSNVDTPEMARRAASTSKDRASIDRKVVKTEVQSRYMNIKKAEVKEPKKSLTPLAGLVKNVKEMGKGVMARTDSGRASIRAKSAVKAPKKEAQGKKGTRSNSSLSSKEVEFQNWKRRKSYDPMKAAAEGKKKMEMAKKQQNLMTQSFTEANQSQDSSPSHSSSVHRSQSFHGTAAMEQLLSSEEDEDEDLTLSPDEGFSPPTPSPCDLSPVRACLRNGLWDRHAL